MKPRGGAAPKAATSKVTSQKPVPTKVSANDSTNKWRKISAATKQSKPVLSESDDDEDDDDMEEESEDSPIAKPLAGKASKNTQPAKKALMHSDEESDEPSGSVPLKSAKAKVAALAKKAAASDDSDEEDDDDEDDEDEEDDDDEEESDDDMDIDEEAESEGESEEEKVRAKPNRLEKSSQKSKKMKFTGDEDEEGDEDDVRLTHRGEELEDDERDAEDYEDETHDQEDEEGEDDGEEAGEKDAAEDEDETLTPQELGERIKETAVALSDFKAHKKRTKTSLSRAQLVARIAKDCAAYYGYLPELIDLFLTLFGPTEMVEFLEANEVSRPTCIRANTLKTTRRELAKALTARGIGLEPVAEWTNVGLKVFESEIPIGATPEYLAGHYMLQSASSLAPVMALDARPGEKVLDMCAAPGGKTSHIAQLMRNEGLLIANDAKLPRMDGLVANLARLGVKIATCVNQDGRDFPKVMGGFDRVLLDAPCSGLGVIPYDKSVKQSRTAQDIAATANLQRELLLAAIDSCDFKSKEGGIIVYSTCSISVQENEQVVQHALERRDVVLVDCGFEFGKPGLTRSQGKVFHPSMKLCKRLYPHTHNMDGFFIAKLKKRSNAILENGKPIAKKTTEGEVKTGDDAKKDAASTDDEDVSSISSDEEKRRKKQSQFAKRKNAKLQKKLGAAPPPSAPPKQQKQQAPKSGRAAGKGAKAGGDGKKGKPFKKRLSGGGKH